VQRIERRGFQRQGNTLRDTGQVPASRRV